MRETELEEHSVEGRFRSKLPPQGSTDPLVAFSGIRHSVASSIRWHSVASGMPEHIRRSMERGIRPEITDRNKAGGLHF